MTDQINPSLQSLGDKIADDDITPIQVQPLPGFLQWMPPFIKDIHAKGAQITTGSDHNLLIGGFYGNGPMILVIDDNGKFFAVDKNKKRVKIAVFDDLVMLNFEWWKAGNTRGKYVAPERPWLDYFRTKNLVKKSVIYVENVAEGDA